MQVPVKRLHLLFIFAALLVLAAFAVFTTARLASANNHLVRINELMAGMNGDSKVQYIVLEAADDSQKAWGPQAEDPAGSPGRAMIVFYNAFGTETGRYVFPSDPADGDDTVLIATAEFAALPGAPTPDFIMPADIIPIAGKVAFQNNPDNINSTSVNVALSYGGAGYSGSTAGADDGANAADLPILNTAALSRQSGFGFGTGTQSNSDFGMSAPNPLNTSGQTFTVVPAVAPLADQGEVLFNEETFLGNGRTCGSCHVSDNGDFGLSPEQVHSKPDDDVLFVAEYNVNTLVVTSSAPSGFAQPSDLRGEITGSTGSATVLAGYGDTYLIYGGDDLSGTITDEFGNSATFDSFTFGDLAGPNPVNGSANGLEDSTGPIFLMFDSLNEQSFPDGRALILENIDGFDQLELFRASPALFNLEHTAPYGFSSQEPDLGDFSAGAVAQHAPRSLLRREGIDFRLPTEEERTALEEFQFGIRLPQDGNYDLDRFAVTDEQVLGREIFFGSAAKCSRCHSGPVLATTDGTVRGFAEGENGLFNTGTDAIPVNGLDGMPPELPDGSGESTRTYSTPGLFGTDLTAPFFHNHTRVDLRRAITFYAGAEFQGSPSFGLVGRPSVVAGTENADRILDFLEALVEPWSVCASGCDFSDIQTALDTIPDGDSLTLIGDFDVSAPLVSGRNGINNVVIYSQSSTLNWVGGANSRVISGQGVGNMSVIGLNITCAANCDTMTAIRAAGNGRILIKNNVISGFDQAINLNGLSDVIIKGNTLFDNETAIQQTDGMLEAYANNIADYGIAYSQSISGTANLENNFWGVAIGETPPGGSGVPQTAWDARLAANVVDWSEISSRLGRAKLGDAELASSSSTGNPVIVSYGRSLTNAPFDTPLNTASGSLCSDYYEYFVRGTPADGTTWTVRVPVDSNAECQADVLSQQRMMEVGSTADCTSPGNTACWDLVTGISTQGGVFQISGLDTADLTRGTYAADSTENLSPTPTPSNTPTPSPTPIPTNTPTPTNTPIPTATFTPTPGPSPTPAMTPTVDPGGSADQFIYLPIVKR
ncbi:MAG: hypothetical protein DHS20C20_22740 [Ardenticatenaceae bacterium]|nr:MAG: hypothetical protein DHS20C20_22740 [Ardenticatenaceae bacterium]